MIENISVNGAWLKTLTVPKNIYCENCCILQSIEKLKES